MREIPKLQVLCLRAVGSQSCSAEETFASHQETGEPSMTSKLLRTYHKRESVVVDTSNSSSIGKKEASTIELVVRKTKKKKKDDEDDDDEDDSDDEEDDDEFHTIHDIPLCRSVCVGKGSTRRANANDVDLNHPMIAHQHTTQQTQQRLLITEHGNPALDCLQSYVDSLVELGRMDDNRLGVHFFEEWKANVLVGAGREVPIKILRKKKTDPQEEKGEGDDGEGKDKDDNEPTEETTITKATPGRPRKRGRPPRNNNTPTATPKLSIRVKATPTAATGPTPLGSISLNNCAIAEETVEAMRDSGMGIYLGVLDMTGIYGLNDTMLAQLLPHCPNLIRFSIKNCRRITVATLQVLAQYQPKLQCLDIGGTYNITPDEVIETLVVGKQQEQAIVAPPPAKKKRGRKKKSATTTSPSTNIVYTIPTPELIELHASGLGWNDALLEQLVGGDQEEDDLDGGGGGGGGEEDDDFDEDEDEDYDDDDYGTTTKKRRRRSSTTSLASAASTAKKPPPRQWKALSLGFSMSFSALGIRHALSKVSKTLISLALHFCENVVDNALMGMLGRNLPHVKYLDVRGNPSLNSMTGWYDGRASADLDTTRRRKTTGDGEDGEEDDEDHDNDEEEHDDEGVISSNAQELTVLARFTGISKASLEETLRIHPLEAANLTCILDGTGAGIGVYR